ncbi:conserved oligomeric Golgi complex subunit 2-like isoform X3 [Mustela lutreola]|uniref:conserved oligomeric Golgi complex subunit 2-like isoform X3 n=1 Tax=Mustela lutreola TaxID=9666 RepID=UPI002797536F|nr:conserved oligomeric Golgi complex subunit 2-like isoform X3 [Mustela lutreola]
MDKALNQLSVPLGQLREVLSLRSSVSEGIRAVDERMCKQEDIRKKKRIAHITAMLQQSLGGLLLEGLQTSNVDIIRHCLQTFATIDKTRDAEALVGQLLVKPYMDEVIVEQIVESHPDGLKIMYASKLLEFVPHHCRLLREVTGGAISRHCDAQTHPEGL